VIGLDVGTHAVRAVEVSVGRGGPVLERMGQVALPPGAVVAGEVADPVAVTAALRRLWRDVAFTSRQVVVGVANAKVVARMTEMPALPDEELRSALAFHARELIPIPMAEAELDFQVTERLVTDEGEERVRLMLVAAQKDMLHALLRAIDGAGLSTTRVDLVALALIRALWKPDLARLGDDGEPGAGGEAARRGDGHEVIIGIGAGVTNVVVHRDGVPTFIRTVPSGGLSVTQAMARELSVPAETAEAVKRDEREGTSLARVATRNAVAPVVGEVAGSLEFHRASAGLDRIGRIQMTGGGSRLALLREAIADRLDAPVDLADPFGQVRIGKVGLDPEAVHEVGPLFTVAIGLALSAIPVEGTGTRISLLPGDVTAKRAERRQVAMAAAGVAAFTVLLVGAALARGAQVSDARSQADQVSREKAALDQQIGELAPVRQLQGRIAGQRQVVVGALDGDLDWSRLVQTVAGGLPDDVWLTSITASPGSKGAAATLQLAGKGADQTSVSRFITGMQSLDVLDDVWVSSATREEGGTGLVTFSASATVTDAAGSHRADAVKAAR
jgi:type IV pilus assembly protein PilM